VITEFISWPVRCFGWYIDEVGQTYINALASGNRWFYFAPFYVNECKSEKIRSHTLWRQVWQRRKFSLLTLQLLSIPSIFAVVVLTNHIMHIVQLVDFATEVGNEQSEFVLSQTWLSITMHNQRNYADSCTRQSYASLSTWKHIRLRRRECFSIGPFLQTHMCSLLKRN
jgi:hypothetical protein